jgi:anti-anti-sigma factor
MEITREKSGNLLVIRLAGRLDANWCNHVQSALAAAVRDGEHRVHLDMAGVNYVSSAGLRVLLSFHKQLSAIHGAFGVARPSAAVRSVLELAGLDLLLVNDSAAPVETDETGQAHPSASATYELFTIKPQTTATEFKLETVGQPEALRRGAVQQRPPSTRFGTETVALGVGALGSSYADCEGRFGEFLAVAGTAAFQPADGSSRPDFVVSQGAYVPEGYLLLGLRADDAPFSTLARFEAKPEARTIRLSDLAQTALELSGASVAVFVAITETAGLVGATLRKSPAPASETDARFTYPGIRDWLSFTSERAFRDSTSLVVGVVARPGTALAPLLRPLGSPSLLGHVHAAAFPYRPLRKGRIDLKKSVDELFEGQGLQAILHLLADPREINGAGDSEFFRGALWIAPVPA